MKDVFDVSASIFTDRPVHVSLFTDFVFKSVDKSVSVLIPYTLATLDFRPTKTVQVGHRYRQLHYHLDVCGSNCFIATFHIAYWKL
jgi:hypothetical protein